MHVKQATCTKEGGGRKLGSGGGRGREKSGREGFREGRVENKVRGGAREWEEGRGREA